MKLTEVAKELPPYNYNRSAIFLPASLVVSGQDFAARESIPMCSLYFNKAWPELKAEGAGLLASSFIAKIEEGTSWKDIKAGIYNTRKCIEAINKCLHRLLP